MIKQRFVNQFDIYGRDGFIISYCIGSSDACQQDFYGTVFVAPRACELIAVSEIHGQSGTDGSAVTLQIERRNSGSGKGSGTTILSSGFSLKSDANIPQTKYSNVDMTTARIIEAGQIVGCVTSGTLTNVRDVCVTLYFKWRDTGTETI